MLSISIYLTNLLSSIFFTIFTTSAFNIFLTSSLLILLLNVLWELSEFVFSSSLLLNISLLNQNGYKISKIATLAQDELEREVKRITSTKSDHDSQISALVIALWELSEFVFSSSLLLNIQSTIKAPITIKIKI